MCRGFQQIDQRDRLLKIKAFHLSFTSPNKPLPDSLTLHYLPRITGGPLEVNGSVFRPDSPAFLTLHRLLSSSDDDRIRIAGGNSVAYGSREKVRVSEGVRFEVYLMEERLVRGGFRKDDEGEWKVECKCGLEGGEMAVAVEDVEVCVAADGGGEVVMREAVEMVVRRRKRGRCFEGLEEIPEQREETVEEYCCCCCDCGGEVVEDGGDAVEDDGGEVEMEVEGVRWAVDVGIWVVCLGVGYFVSKASMRRRRRLL